MVNQQLIDYVRNTLSLGYGEPELRAFLLGRGFAFEDVNAAFDIIQGLGPSDQPPQPQPQPQYQAQPMNPLQPGQPQPQPRYQAQPTTTVQPGQPGASPAFQSGYQQQQAPQTQAVSAQPSAKPSIQAYPATFKHRNPALVILFSILTLGIYACYWLVATTNELKKVTTEAPNPMLLLLALVPLVNIVVIIMYYVKYCKAVELLTGFNATGLFLLFLFFPPAAQAVTQVKLNRIADN